MISKLAMIQEEIDLTEREFVEQLQKLGKKLNKEERCYNSRRNKT